MKPLPETLVLPPRTLASRGALGRLFEGAESFGPRGRLVCGGSLRRSGTLDFLKARCPEGMELGVWEHAGGEPTLDDLEALRAELRRNPPDWVAAVGGGSVLDLAKAAAGLWNAPLSSRDYHGGAPIPPSKMPFLAAPTTAGTGSEATTVSVLIDAETLVKKSIRHPDFMARIVILDPDRLAGCPPSVLAASGMDAFTQAVESLLSRHATDITAAWSLRAARRLADALPSAFAHARAASSAGSGTDSPRFEALLFGSFLAGMALANARLGLVHGLAHPLGARCHQPHGRVCAACLPEVLAFNREAAPEAYANLAEALGGDPLAVTRRLIEQLELHSPFRGQPIPDRDAVVRETLASGSTAANPRPVSAADVHALLDRLF